MPSASKKNSIEKIAERSEYDRGKQDGLAEAVQLLREQADHIDKTYETINKPTATVEEIKLHVAFVSGMRKSALNLWTIYKRRAV